MAVPICPWFPVSNTTFSFYQDSTPCQQTVTTTEQIPSLFTSSGALVIIAYIVDTGLLSVLACLGVVTNSLNLAVFAKQGFKDSINISMTYIAFWDLTKCLTGLVQRLYWPISFVSVPVAESWRTLLVPISIYMSVFSGYVSCVITTWVSVERCVCVVFPFSAKNIFRPKYTLLIVTCISIFVFGAFIVMFFMFEIVYRYDSSGNVILNLLYNDFYKSNMMIVRTYYKVTATLLPIASFAILTTSSCIILLHLRRSHSLFIELREILVDDTGTTSRPALSRREKHVTRTLLAVVGTYTACMFPRIFAVDIPSLIEPEYYALMKYHNIFLTVCNFMLVLDFTSASMNFFIFYKLSTNYWSTFFLVCSGCVRK